MFITAGCCVMCMSLQNTIRHFLSKKIFDFVVMRASKLEKIRTFVPILDSSESSHSVEGES